MQTRYGIRDSLTRTNKVLGGGITEEKIGNLLEDFKTEILGTLTKQLDFLQEKHKRFEAE